MPLISQIAAGARGLSSANPVFANQNVQGSAAAGERGLSTAAPVIGNLPVHGFQDTGVQIPTPQAAAAATGSGVDNYYTGVSATGGKIQIGQDNQGNAVYQQPNYAVTDSPTQYISDNIDKYAANQAANGNPMSTEAINAMKQTALQQYQANLQTKQDTFQNQQQADQTAGGTIPPPVAPQAPSGTADMTQQTTQNSQNTGSQNTGGTTSAPPQQNTPTDTSGGQSGPSSDAFSQPSGNPEGPPTQSGQFSSGSGGTGGASDTSGAGGTNDNTGGSSGSGSSDNSGGASGSDQNSGTDLTGLQDLTLPTQIQQMLSPMLDGLTQQYSTAGDMLQSELGNIQQNRAMSDFLYEQGSQNALLGYQRSLDLTQQMSQAQKDVIDEQKRSDLATLQNTQAQQDAQYNFEANQQRLTNIQNEQANRITAAKEGVNVDSGGLDWMAREVQRGQDSLNYIYTQAALADKDIGNKMLNTINTWGNQMEQLDAQTNQQYGQAYSDYVSTIQSLQKNRLTDLQSQQTQMTQARQDYMTTLNGIDKTKATLMGTLTTALDSQSRLAMMQQYHKDMLGMRQAMMQLSMGKFDTTTYNTMFSKQQDIIKGINTAISSTNPDVKAYEDGLTFKKSFDVAYGDWQNAQKSGNKGLEAAASAQIAIQFSHFQNSGSLRLSDLGAQDSVAYESLTQKLQANFDKWTNPNIGAPPDVVDGMNTLMQDTAQARQSLVQDTVNQQMAQINQWNNTPNMSQNYPTLTISPSQITLPIGITAPSNDTTNVQQQYPNGLPPPPESGGGSDQSTNEGSTYNSQIPEQGTPSFSQSSPFAQFAAQRGLRITQYYNGTYDQNHPINGQPIFSDGRPTHESYNISPPTPGDRNTPAPVYQAGTVVQVQHSTKGYGNSVRIKDAQGNTWIYGHLANTDVKVGQQVNAGDKLGLMGDTGYATGVTMHLEARGPDGKPFDFASDGTNPAADIAYNSTDTSTDPTMMDAMLLSTLGMPAF